MPYKDPDVRRAKACEYSQQWRQRNLAQAREIGRTNFAKNRTNWKRRPPEEMAAYMRSYRKLHAPKMRAYEAVKRALKTGVLIKPPICNGCGEHRKLEAHHHLGYAKEHRLHVVWLCITCHNKLHVDLNLR